jgi:hypothetical protein
MLHHFEEQSMDPQVAPLATPFELNTDLLLNLFRQHCPRS